MRFVLGLDALSHIGPEHFRFLIWLPVGKRVDQIVLGHMSKVKHGCPQTIWEEILFHRMFFIHTIPS